MNYKEKEWREWLGAKDCFDLRGTGFCSMCGQPTAKSKQMDEIIAKVKDNLLSLLSDIKKEIESLRTPKELCTTGDPCEFENRTINEITSILNQKERELK